ncbi:MAG: twin-arginine translocase subunit TatC [Elusimicrobia bacterium]|nr:twin-arginine translocase subunit TatC [Elusimicrobiota bacterium]
MPLVEHLTELRQRLLRGIVAFLVCAGITSFYASDLLDLLLIPAGTVVFLSPGDAFGAWCSLVFLGGSALCFPYLLFEMWSFVSSGLSPREKRAVGVYGLFCLLSFLLALVFVLGFLLPFAYRFLLSFSTERLVPMITVNGYLSFVWSIFWGSLIAFELPPVLLLLVQSGVVSVSVLIRVRPFILVGIVVLAAFLTPPDIVSQLLLALPLWGIFEGTILWARIGRKKKPPS